MSINPYFKHQRGEQRIIEDLTIEAIKIYGQNLIYMPRTLVDEDRLFGEDISSSFTDGIEIEMYISSVDGFEGDGDFLNKFGIEVRDTMKVVVSKKRFEKEVTTLDSDIEAPREGDLVYFPLSGGLFEITFVEDENPFYQLGKLYTYELSCELYKFSQETISTGFTDIDSVTEDKTKEVVNLTINSGYTGDFRIGELVRDGSSNVAEVIGWDSDSNILQIIGLTGSIGLTGITGDNSSATGVVGATGSPSTTIVIPTDDFTDNESIQTEGQDYINFSEFDPFSEGDI